MREAVLTVRALCLTSLKAVAVSAVFLAGAVLLDPVTPGSLVSSAVAQDDKPKQDKRETRRTPALRNKVYERLAEAQGLAEAKDFAGAAAPVAPILTRPLNCVEYRQTNFGLDL